MHIGEIAEWAVRSQYQGESIVCEDVRAHCNSIRSDRAPPEDYRLTLSKAVSRSEKAKNAREFALLRVHLWPKIIDVQTIRKLCEHICNAGADSYAHACPVIGDHSLTRSLR